MAGEDSDVPLVKIIDSRSIANYVFSIIFYARRRVYIGAYVFNDKSLIGLVLTKARENLDVKVVTSDHEENRLFWSAAKGRVDFRVYKPGTGGIFHAKVVVADDWVYLGSANLSFSGLDRNVEIGAIIRSSRVSDEVASWITEYFEAGFVPRVRKNTEIKFPLGTNLFKLLRSSIFGERNGNDERNNRGRSSKSVV